MKRGRYLWYGGQHRRRGDGCKETADGEDADDEVLAVGREPVVDAVGGLDVGGYGCDHVVVLGDVAGDQVEGGAGDFVSILELLWRGRAERDVVFHITVCLTVGHGAIGCLNDKDGGMLSKPGSNLK